MGLRRLGSALCLGLITLRGAVTAGAEPPSDRETGGVRPLAILLQVVRSLEENVPSGELGQVHNEDMFVYGAIGQLIAEARAAQEEELSVALVVFNRKVADLHTAADDFDREQARQRLGPVLEAFEKIKAAYDPKRLAAARSLADRFTCPMHPDVVVDHRGDPCPKCGMPLDALARVSPFDAPGTPALKTIKASIHLYAPLTMGQEAQGTLRLSTRGGEPVELKDLREVHTRKIHLLIIDGSLSDYHHEHPDPTEIPGEYRFTFTPRKPGSYRAWADVQPLLTGFQEYAMADLPSPQAASEAIQTTVSTSAALEGLHYTLSASDPIKAGKAARVRLRVTASGGRPFGGLEPLMGAFAHLVAFREDGRSVLHMHPLQTRALKQEERGGPDLEFQIYADKPGFYRLFLQVQIMNASKFVPLGIEVLPQGDEKRGKPVSETGAPTPRRFSSPC
jgi:hypothetical protein